MTTALMLEEMIGGYVAGLSGRTERINLDEVDPIRRVLVEAKSRQWRHLAQECIEDGWSRNVLVHQIENQTFERTIGNQTNFAAALDQPESIHAHLAVKDEYTFAFLGLEDEHSERELEQAITGRAKPS